MNKFYLTQSIHVLVFIHIFWIRWHILIAIIFICHVTCSTSVTTIINCILIDWYAASLHRSWICWRIIKTIIEHHHASSSPWFSNCWYTSNFLLWMYRLIRAVMFHFIIIILSKSTWALTWYYHLLLHTCWWTYLISLYSSTWYSKHATMTLRWVNAWQSSHIHS